ncbi:MAG: TonB-dependent receptor [Gammaproteobacteria bacterium]|nr:TonB-dependent receptor [Gammaproteobacteria bacterium]
MSHSHKASPIRMGVRHALYASALFTLVAHVPAAQAQDDDDESVEEIVVTGSRLIRQDYVAISPIATVDSDLIQNSGNPTLEETLNMYPQLNPDSTSSSNQSGGDGVLAPDLRGLGAVRTLLLVNGKRFIPASVTGLSDMAAIPDMLIDRVEISTGGASAVYGSDAIAGAINFIMRDDFEGVDFRYQWGEASEGDGATTKLDFLFGANTSDGNGNITLHASYTERDPVFMENREFSFQPFLADSTGQLNEFGSGNIPGGKIFIPSSDFALINGVDLVGAAASCPGPIQGIRFGANGEPLPFCRPTDQFNYAATNFILRPLERWQFSALGNYEIADGVDAYVQAFYTKKENQWQQAALATAPTSSGASNGTLLIPNADTNPLFPAALQQFFADNAAYFDPDGDGVFETVGNGRRFLEFGPRNAHILTDSYGITGGLRGDAEIGNKTWAWDAFYQYQRSDLNETRTGLLSRSRTTLGLDVVVVNGEPQCRVQLLNCVPVNVYGTDTLTPEMANFLTVSTGRSDNFERTVFGGTIAGDLFELPAGPVSTAFGFEWRDEEYQTAPDEISKSGDLGGVAPIDNQGTYDLWEIYAEARFPVVENFAVEGAVRYSDYSTIGGVTTWRVGLDWTPLEYLRGRASVSQAIRAPNLDELFAAPNNSFIGGVDPCVVDNNPTPEIKAVCLQQGVPPNVIDDLQVGASQGWSAFSGGNPLLEEEESDTTTLGVVVSPPFAEGLIVSLDYWEIDVDSAISQVSSQALVNACFQLLDNSAPSCQAITRDQLGNIETVNAPLLNLQTRAGAGIDLQIDYALDLPDSWGVSGDGATLDLRWLSTFHDEDSTVLLAGQPAIECAGFLGGSCSGNFIRATPDYRGLLSGTYNSGPVSIRTDFEIIGDFDLAADAFPNNNVPVDAQYYWDLNGTYQINDRVQLFAGVSNVLDEQPPLIGFRAGGDSNTQAQLYDTIGRRYFLGARVSLGSR